MFYLITPRVAVVGVGVYSCMSRRGEDFISGCDPGGVGCGDLSCDDRLMMTLIVCCCWCGVLFENSRVCFVQYVLGTTVCCVVMMCIGETGCCDSALVPPFFWVGCWCAGLIPYMFFDLIEVMFFGVVL